MNKFPPSMRSFRSQIFLILAATGFFVASVLFYEPALWMKLLYAGEGLYRSIDNIFIFNLPIVTAIVGVSLLILRIIFYYASRKMDLTLIRYGIWCGFEWLVSSAFVALYLVLMAQGDTSYFIYWGRCFAALSSILLYPYLIVTLLYALDDALHADPADTQLRLKFYDNRHQLKFVCAAGDLLYIRSDENYIRLYYHENGQIKAFILRNSLKSVEPLCERAGFVRTHRCYIVNPRFIKTIKKDGHGFFFVDLGAGAIKNGDEEGIPVSKKYYDAVAAVL